MTSKASDIADLLRPTVESLGLELLGIEYLPAPGGATVRLYIDVTAGSLLPEGAAPVLGDGAAVGDDMDAVDDGSPRLRMVTIEDCEAVSREVSAQLDVEDPISGNYTLEVSSPGVDRPLFSLAQFARHRGEMAKVVLQLPQDGRRRFQGEIAGVNLDTGMLVFDVEGNDFQVSYDNIDKARLVPDWVALGLAPAKPGKGPGSGNPKAPKGPGVTPRADRAGAPKPKVLPAKRPGGAKSKTKPAAPKPRAE